MSVVSKFIAVYCVICIIALRCLYFTVPISTVQTVGKATSKSRADVDYFGHDLSGKCQF